MGVGLTHQGMLALQIEGRGRSWHRPSLGRRESGTGANGIGPFDHRLQAANQQFHQSEHEIALRIPDGVKSILSPFLRVEH